MSNPVVTVTNDIPMPSVPTTVRKSYMMKVFDSIPFFLYGEGQDSGSFDPTDMGSEFYLWYRVGSSIATPPTFVTTGSWVGLAAAPSGFITPNYSVMPKLIGPSTLMVDNGLETANGNSGATWGPSGKKLFNWVIDTVNGTTVGPASTDLFQYAQLGSPRGAQSISVKAKSDSNAANTVVMHLPALTDPPTGDWDSADLVGGGAFTLMLNILGMTPASADPAANAENRWSIVISFGDVTMTIADASTMKVNIAGDGTMGNDTSVNLAEGAAKESTPQAQHISDKPPLLISVYPCWNGIVVVCGQQDTPEVVKTAATYCRKMKSATIQDPAYCGAWFDPTSPSDIEILGGDAAPDIKVDFGKQIDVTASNCRFEMAYTPKFFTTDMAFDGWLLLADDNNEITYDYNVYTIYTKNGTDYAIATPAIVNSGEAGEADNTSFWYIPWSMSIENYPRWGGEIFAYILETEETRTHSIKNGNGNFDLTWSGGTPAGSGNWKKYIKNVSVTVGIDGSSGSITVDKYGVAGQDAIADQKIGAVVISATGGVGTTGGDIFYGLGMGVSVTNSSGDAIWTIPLFGLEKKLEDMALINPPYLDGYTLGDAVDYLCGYAGIRYQIDGDAGINLSATQEINSARFDWKSGTSVKTALEDVLEDVNYGYVVRDGFIWIYKKDSFGLPVNLGTDWAAFYDNTKIVMIDKTPDFDNLRNYIIAMALQLAPEGMGTRLQQVPSFPMMEARTKTTVPDIPWAKCYVRAFSAPLAAATLSNIVDRISYATSVYELTGKLSIPGNASIKPYDRWGDSVIMSVTHTINLEAKTWMTDLDFMKTGV